MPDLVKIKLFKRVPWRNQVETFPENCEFYEFFTGKG